MALVSQSAAESGIVQERARQALANSPFHDLRSIRVDQQHGALLLDGRVSSFYYKQLAQEIVRAVCREVEVVNAIDVHWQNDR